jgi:AraC-like DNA-binding protein
MAHVDEMAVHDFEFSSTDGRLPSHPSSAFSLALGGLLGDVRIDHVCGVAPSSAHVEVRTGADTAVGAGSHELVRGTWQIVGDGGQKSLFLAVFDQVRTTVLTQGRRVDVPAGHLFVASSKVPFTVIHEGAYRWHLIRVDVSVIRLPPATVERVLYRPHELSPYLRQLIENVIPVTAARDEDGRPTVDVVGFDRYVAGLAEMILRSVRDAEHDLVPGTARRQLVERYILRNLTDAELSVSTVAAAHSISRRRLYQLFKDSGVGVAEFIRQARIDRAKALLADPAYRDQMIGQIAELVGIHSAAHFSRLFRVVTGRSPRAFRRSTVRTPLGQEEPASTPRSNRSS